jgi:ligand-binding sensor domain-containing protein
MTIQTSNGGLWFSGWGDGTLNYYIPDGNKLSSIDLEGEIQDVCVTDRIWILQIESPKLISLDENTLIQVSHPEIDDFEDLGNCITTNQNEAIFFGNTFMLVHDGKNFSRNYWTVNKELMRVVEDDQGLVWALTREGEIYIADEDFQWRLFGQVDENAYRIKFIGNTLWFGIPSEVYKWDLADQGMKPEFVLQIPREKTTSFLISVDEVTPGVIWITTTAGIWKYSSNNLEDVKLPLFIKHINRAVFDSVSSKIYIATDRGVYVQEFSSD